MSAPDGQLVWVAIVAAALGTWIFRLSFVVLFGYLEEIPPRIDQALHFIPPAVIAAIIGPSVLLVDGTLAVTFDNERLLAAVVAMIVAWYTEEMLATIAAGLLTLWAFVFLV